MPGAALATRDGCFHPHADLDEAAAAAPTSTEALEPAVNGDAAAVANGDATAAADAAAEAEAKEVASFFKKRRGEGAVEYAARVFERLYSFDIEKVISMEVCQCLVLLRAQLVFCWYSTCSAVSSCSFY